jgi:hypothetical protein
MATPGQMPMCNEQSVPSFDLTRLRELVRYFEELEDHFSHCTITDLANRKKWMLKYVPMQVADLWKSLPEWTSATDWATLHQENVILPFLDLFTNRALYVQIWHL